MAFPPLVYPQPLYFIYPPPLCEEVKILRRTPDHNAPGRENVQFNTAGEWLIDEVWRVVLGKQFFEGATGFHRPRPQPQAGKKGWRGRQGDGASRALIDTDDRRRIDGRRQGDPGQAESSALFSLSGLKCFAFLTALRYSRYSRITEGNRSPARAPGKSAVIREESAMMTTPPAQVSYISQPRHTGKQPLWPARENRKCMGGLHVTVACLTWK